MIGRTLRPALTQIVGAPASVARIDGDASVMSPLAVAAMAIEQQAADLHHRQARL
jgi:hypothetical protein